MGLDHAAEQQPDDRRRQERHEQLGDEDLRVAPGEQTDREFGELDPVLPYHRQHRAGLDHDEERVLLLALEVEQVARQDQVPGAGDRQEFGEAFDDAEDCGFEQRAEFDHAGLVRVA
jgi:hypothetical protein